MKILISKWMREHGKKRPPKTLSNAPWSLGEEADKQGFGLAFRQLMKARGKTYKDVAADLFGMTKQGIVPMSAHVALWAQGKSYPMRKNAIKLAMYFDVPLERLRTPEPGNEVPFVFNIDVKRAEARRANGASHPIVASEPKTKDVTEVTVISPARVSDGMHPAECILRTTRKRGITYIEVRGIIDTKKALTIMHLVDGGNE